VDLTGPSNHAEIREPPPALQILESARRDFIQHRAQGASDDAGNDCDGSGNNDNSDYGSDASELPPLAAILSKAEKKLQAGLDLGLRPATCEQLVRNTLGDASPEGGNGVRANPAADAVVSIFACG